MLHQTCMREFLPPPKFSQSRGDWCQWLHAWMHRYGVKMTPTIISDIFQTLQLTTVIRRIVHCNNMVQFYISHSCDKLDANPEPNAALPQ